MKIKLYKTTSAQKGLLEGVQLCCNLPVVCLNLFDEHVPHDCMTSKTSITDYARLCSPWDGNTFGTIYF